MLDNRMARAVIAEQMLDNLRERLGNLLLDHEYPLLDRGEIQLLLDMTALPVKEEPYGA